MIIKKNLKVNHGLLTHDTIAEIQRSAATGIYDIRGGGSKEKFLILMIYYFWVHQLSRYPLEGYREKCNTSVVIGDRFAKKPIELIYQLLLQE